MSEETTDIGRTPWFRAIVGMLWLVVIALVGTAIYSVAPILDPLVRVSPALASTALTGLAVLAIAYAVTHFGTRRTRPS